MKLRGSRDAAMNLAHTLCTRLVPLQRTCKSFRANLLQKEREELRFDVNWHMECSDQGGHRMSP